MSKNKSEGFRVQTCFVFLLILRMLYRQIFSICHLAPKCQEIIFGRYFCVGSKYFNCSMFNSAMKSKFTVCVEGNIASGKTKLLDYFKKFPSIVEIVEEPTKQWRDLHGHNVLAKMYEDPSRWGAIFQSYSQLTMTELHTSPHTCPVKLMERSLYSGRYCFIENLHNSKVMPDVDYTVLSEWFTWLTTSHNINVDLIVYLRTKPEVLLERIQKRLRPEEQCIPLKYLQDLHNLHEDWLINKTTYQPPAPVLVLDANNSISEMYKIFEEEKSKILFGLAPNST